MSGFTTVMMVVAAGVSAYSAYAQGEAQQEQADYQASVDRNNAVIADNNAKQSEEDARVTQTRAADTAGEQMDKTRRMMASQNAATAGSGILTNSGSVLDILDQSATYGAMDAGRIRANGQMDANNLLLNAQGFKQKAQDFRTNALNQEWQGQQAKNAGTVSMIGSAMKGSSSMYGAYKGKP